MGGIFMADQYFYKFLEPVSQELANTLKELESTIFTSPRAMLTHSRVLIESVINKVLIHERLYNELGGDNSLVNKIYILEKHELLDGDALNAYQRLRIMGNQAAHDERQFRFSEALLAWEYLHTAMKWFVEIYVSYNVDVPPYEDPKISVEKKFDLEEINARFEKIEDLLLKSIEEEKETKGMTKRLDIEAQEQLEAEISKQLQMEQEPGDTIVRTLFYQGERIDIPNFLKEAFLLPQRFPESINFLLRLNQSQEARIMSELPKELDHIHDRAKGYGEANTEKFFNELKVFVEEEKRRRKLENIRHGDFILYYRDEEIIVTDILAKVAINHENFTGIPSLINHLMDDGISKIGDLPKEFIILEKYEGIGPKRVKEFFDKIKEIQKKDFSEVH